MHLCLVNCSRACLERSAEKAQTPQSDINIHPTRNNWVTSKKSSQGDRAIRRLSRHGRYTFLGVCTPIGLSDVEYPKWNQFVAGNYITLRQLFKDVLQFLKKHQ